TASTPVNDNGQVIGLSATTGGTYEHAFLYSGSVMTGPIPRRDRASDPDRIGPDRRTEPPPTTPPDRAPGRLEKGSAPPPAPARLRGGGGAGGTAGLPPWAGPAARKGGAGAGAPPWLLTESRAPLPMPPSPPRPTGLKSPRRGPPPLRDSTDSGPIPGATEEG